MWAAESGHIPVIEWATENGLGDHMDEYVLVAATNGHLEVLKFFKKKGYSYSLDSEALRAAVLNGHLQVAQWLKDHGKCQWMGNTEEIAHQKWPGQFD